MEGEIVKILRFDFLGFQKIAYSNRTNRTLWPLEYSSRHSLSHVYFFSISASVYKKWLCNSVCFVHCVVVLGYSDGSVGGAVVAVILIHLVIVMFVYKAWTEGQDTQPIKQD